MVRALSIFRYLGTVVVVTMTSLVYGQTSTMGVDPSALPQNIEDALHQMSDKAAVVFVGQVLAIKRDGTNSIAGVVEVDFSVDRAIRGCSLGTYSLREWAGLWAADDQRYRVGQRLLMLLHAPSAAGMSSPVDGLDGAIPIRGVDTSVLTTTGATGRQVSVADLRWVGIKLLHPVVYRSGSVRSSFLPTPFVVPQRAASATDATGAPAPVTFSGGIAGAESTPSQQASVDTVVGMLTSWQAQHEVR
jgi:hypothetical protein